MLFSLKHDPSERNNLVNQPEYKVKLEELRSKCEEELNMLLENEKCTRNDIY